MTVPQVTTPPIVRFMRKVDKTPDGHWLWTGVKGGKAPHQYGYFRPGTRPTDPKSPTHRWLYEQLFGPVAADLEVDHVCKVKLCCNPDHLEVVTSIENARRKRLVTCRAGLHDLTDPARAVWDKHGRRRGCKACASMRDRARGRGQ